MPDKRLLQHPGLKALYDSLQSDWNQQQYTAVALLLSALALIAYGAMGGDSMIMVLIGGLAGIGSVWWLFELSQQKPVSELYHLLLEEPERIVWVYGLVTERLPFGLSFAKSAVVYLVLDDSQEISAKLPAEKMKLVIKTLQRVLPNTLFGYTEEREQQFRGEVTRRNFSWWNWDDDKFM